ncbi:MAG: hypothetical protein JOY70_08845 [Acidisphaera sp.]|nr:hypothetical protein [Acidisphaera sp.]MBV9812968.1 hypothetical protein [Acetobacteraceae bacterium]
MPEELRQAEDESGPALRGATSVFQKIEHATYAALGLLLAVVALVALVHCAQQVWGSIVSWNDPTAVFEIMDELLFVLMVVEILHTVRVSIQSGVLDGEPFLIVGLIASIRRVLVITLESSRVTKDAGWNDESERFFRASMIELGVLAALIMVMVTSIMILRRRRGAQY